MDDMSSSWSIAAFNLIVLLVFTGALYCMDPSRAVISLRYLCVFFAFVNAVELIIGYYDERRHNEREARSWRELEKEKEQWFRRYQKESEENTERDMELEEFRRKAEAKDMIQRIEKEVEEELKKGEPERTRKFIETYGDDDE